MPKTITHAQLYQLGACTSQLDLFRKTFGEEIAVSHDLVQQVVELEFSIEWATRHLLSPSAVFVYRRALAPAQAAFDETEAQDNVAYDAVIEQAGGASFEALEQAYTVSSMVMEKAEAVYQTAKVHAFVNAYLSDANDTPAT